MSKATSFRPGGPRRPKPGSITRILAAALAICVLQSCINRQSTHLAYVTSGNGGVLGYRIKDGNGLVTGIFTSPFLVGDSAAGIVVHPSNQFVLVSNQSNGSISLLEIDHTSGALTEKLPRTPAGLNPGPMLLDANGAFLYVADQGLNQILTFSVATDGVLSQVSSVQLAQTPAELVLTSSGFLIVAVPALSDVYVFSISAGVLTQVCSGGGPVCLPFNVPNGVSGAASGLAVDPAGKFLYVPNPNPAADTVSGFAIGPNGALTPVPGVLFATGTSPTGATVDPSGKFLYVVNNGANTISEYTIDSTNGDLTAFTIPTQTIGTGSESITFDPDGTFAYVATAKSFTQFLLLSNGTFFSTGNSLQVGSTPLALAMTK